MTARQGQLTPPRYAAAIPQIAQTNGIESRE